MGVRISVPFDGEVSFATATKSRLYAVEDGIVEVDAEDVTDFLRILEGTITATEAKDSKPEKAADSSSKSGDKE
jgi:F0F1-type ATP synthase epsilon subunit